MGFLDNFLSTRRNQTTPGGSFNLAGVGAPGADAFSLGLDPASRTYGLNDRFDIGIGTESVAKGIAGITAKKAKSKETRQLFAAQLPNLVRILTAHTSAELQGALSDVAASNERAQQLADERRETERNRAFSLYRDSLGFTFEEKMALGQQEFTAKESSLSRELTRDEGGATRQTQKDISAAGIASNEGEGDQNRAADLNRFVRGERSEESRFRRSLSMQGAQLNEQRMENFREHLRSTAIPGAMGIELGVTNEDEFNLEFDLAMEVGDPYTPGMARLAGRALAAERILQQPGESDFDKAIKLDTMLTGEYAQLNELGILPRGEDMEVITLPAYKASRPAGEWAQDVYARATTPLDPNDTFNLPTDPVAQYHALAPEARAAQDQAIVEALPAAIGTRAQRFLAEGLEPNQVRQLLAVGTQGADAVSRLKRDLVEEVISDFERKKTLDLRSRTKAAEKENKALRFSLDQKKNDPAFGAPFPQGF